MHFVACGRHLAPPALLPHPHLLFFSPAPNHPGPWCLWRRCGAPGAAGGATGASGAAAVLLVPPGGPLAPVVPLWCCGAPGCLLALLAPPGALPGTAAGTRPPTAQGWGKGGGGTPPPTCWGPVERAAAAVRAAATVPSYGVRPQLGAPVAKLRGDDPVAAAA